VSREEDNPKGNTISNRINEILDCGYRYAKYKLCRNRQKADPKTLTYRYLLDRLKEEVEELEEVLGKVELHGYPEESLTPEELVQIAHEAGDIICFASMICS
jgi:hypothetical protein